MDITRRGFFFGAAAVAASTALGGDEVDGNLTVDRPVKIQGGTVFMEPSAVRYRPLTQTSAAIWPFL